MNVMLQYRFYYIIFQHLSAHVTNLYHMFGIFSFISNVTINDIVLYCYKLIFDHLAY